MSSYRVGLTGGIGSGKSSAAAIFEELGAAVIDADAIAHDLTRPGGAAIAAIKTEFGAGYIDANGALDRAKMRGLAFADAGAKRRLEAILHPLIRAESERLAAAAANPYVVMMIPLLVESGRIDRTRLQRVAVVDCPEEIQIARVMQRSKLGEHEVRAIMAVQATRAERLAAADDVIDNSGAADRLRDQVKRLHHQYLMLAAA